MIVLSRATTGRPAASASETSGWTCTVAPYVAALRLLGRLDHRVRRIIHRHLLVAALAGFSRHAQDLAGLNILAMPGPEGHPDLAAVIADDDPAERFSTFGDVFDLADAAFDCGAAPRNQAVHLDHRSGLFRVLVVLCGLVFAPPNPHLDLFEFGSDALLQDVRECFADPGLDVVGNDGGRRVRDSADRPGALVPGLVVQKSSQYRRIRPARQ